ncbi:peptidase domain-containing ABC transporter [Enterobacter ludwigii]|uniref:peptidase domain-containing ABC transporter n=1 Tax=Enterobacter ludwigii TaxID=299767 RepID=UPI003D1FBC86
MIFKKKQQDVLQYESSECGLACISYISGFYGNYIPLEQLRHQYDVPSEGLSFFHVMKICSEFGMIASGVNILAENIEELQTPSILLWDNCHFVVLKKVNKNNVYIMDPAVGSRAFTREEFNRFFSCVALEVTPTLKLSVSNTNKDNVKKDHNIYKELINVYQGVFKYKAFIIPFVLLSIIIHVANIAIPKFISLVFDEVLPQNDEDFLWLLLYIFAFVYFIHALSGYFKIIVSQRLRRYISWSEGLRVIQCLYQMDSKYFAKRMPSDIVRKIKSIDVLHILYTGGWVDICIDIVFTCILITLLFFISPELTLLTMVMTAVIIFIRFIFLPVIMSRQYSALDAEIKRDNSLLMSVDDIHTIKMNHSEYKRIDDWSHYHADIEYNRSSIERLNSFVELSTNTISHMQTLIIMGYGAYSVLKGESTAGQLISYVFYKNIIMGNIQSVVEKHINVKLCSVELKRLSDLENHNSTIDNDAHFKSSALCNVEKLSSVQVSNVSFCYSNLEDYFIRDFNLQISNDDKVVIIGPSGCGKTTVLNILNGLLSPSRGILYINGIALDKFGVKQYHEQIAMVSADDKIIDGNIIENILHESEYYDMPLLEECIDSTGLDNVIQCLHAGLNTRLGVNGVQLSSGQQQRLMLARALYKKPRLILLDEPTSHLDDESRDLIIKLISSLPMMCIIVSHDEKLINAIAIKVKVS